MAWFLIWAGMILAWGAGVFLGLRWLWRKVVGLGRELEHLAELADRLTATMSNPPPVPPLQPIAVGTDGQDAARRVQDLRRSRLERKSQRMRAHRRRYRRWATLAGWAG